MTYATDHVYHRTVYDVIRHGADGTQGRLATLTKRKEAEICVCELEDMESFDTGDGLEVINRQQPKPRWHGAPTALAVQMAEKEAATKV